MRWKNRSLVPLWRKRNSRGAWEKKRLINMRTSESEQAWGKGKGGIWKPFFPKTKELWCSTSETAQGEHSSMADENTLGLLLPILEANFHFLEAKTPESHIITVFIALSPWLCKECTVSACNAGDSGDTGSISVLGRSPGGDHGNPLQYSCLENPMDRGVWWATVLGVQRVGKDWWNWAGVHPLCS